MKDAHFKAYPDWKWSNKEKRKESTSSLTPRLSTTSDDGDDDDAHTAFIDGNYEVYDFLVKEITTWLHSQ